MYINKQQQVIKNKGVHLPWTNIHVMIHTMMATTTLTHSMTLI